jgi:hypothetical protein
MGRGQIWVPLALVGFAELTLVTVELFRRSAAAAELGTHFSATPSGEHYEGLFGMSFGGYGTSQQLISISDSVTAYTAGSGPGWLYALIAAFLAIVLWIAVTRDEPLRARVLVALVVGVFLAVPLLDLVAFRQFGLDAGTRGPVLATLGLALVAWAARSPLVLAAAVLSGGIAVAVADLPGVLVSAAVLLAAAILPRWGVHRGTGSRWPRWDSRSW